MQRTLLRPGTFTLLLCCIYALVMSPIVPGFASQNNAVNILVALLPLLVVAAGQTVVLITAGIDLSMTATIALASVAGATIMQNDALVANSQLATTIIAIMTMTIVGAAIGTVNGTSVAFLHMPPFIVTLTTMMFFSGLAVWSTQSESISGFPPSFLFVGQNIGVATAIAIGVAAVLEAMLRYTWSGWSIRAIGSNARTAHVSGVNVRKTLFATYVISGLCAGVAAILITAQLETGSPVHWENNLLDIVGATVIGGTSLFGGRGSILWTIGGVLLLTLIDNSLNLMNLSHFTIMIAKGGVILTAAMLDVWQNRGDKG